MSLTAALEAAAAGFTLRAPDEDAPPASLDFEELRAGKPRGVGIYVKHLATGEEAGVRADEVFEAQSVIKLAILLRAYELGLDLDERLTLRRADFVGGTGVLRTFREGLNPTVGDLVTQMIVTSDNTATDLLLPRIGGVAALNEWLRQSGYEHARLASTGRDSSRASEEFAAFAALPLREVRALAVERGIPLFFAELTPREAGRMLETIEAHPDMRATLLDQQLGWSRLPHFLDEDVGHKTGENPPWDANDVGIVYTRSGPVVVVVFANDLGGVYGEQEDRIGRIGRLVVDHFART